MELKYRIFADLDRLAPPGAILATNTSAISITAIAARTAAATRKPASYPAWLVPIMPMTIGPEAPAIRREQLRRYLDERIGHARLLLVAEAAGYQGAKFSGIAMTSSPGATPSGRIGRARHTWC